MAVDAFFYHKLVLVPWRIVSYNIFSGAGRGPEIFGTEPFDFYIRNLLLNFNLWFVLALCAGPLLVLQYVLQLESSTRFTFMRNVFFVSPFYMWLAIFSAQAHKEERFMYPAYPFLALNAAIALHYILGYIGNADPKKLTGMIPAKLKFVVVLTSVILAIDIGILRTLGVVSAYRAPLQIYAALQQPDMDKTGEIVCLGKEWYRFPSSYFLPNGMHAKFIRSDFDGLLPGEFSEAKVGFGFFAGTWLIPAGMNDQNLADPGKYVWSLKICADMTLTRASSTYLTAPIWWIHTSLLQTPHSWNRTTFLISKSGNGCSVLDFWMPQIQALSVDSSGYRKSHGFLRGIGETGEIIA